MRAEKMKIGVRTILRVQKDGLDDYIFFEDEQIHYNPIREGRYTKREKVQISSWLKKWYRVADWEERKRSLEAHIRGFKKDKNIFTRKDVKMIWKEMTRMGTQELWKKLKSVILKKPKYPPGFLDAILFPGGFWL